MGTGAESAQLLLDRGIERTKSGRFGEAGLDFLAAIELIQAWPEEQAKQNELAMLAELLFRTGHPDLALMALQGLLESKERRSSPGKHIGDLLTLANSWNRLGRPVASSIVNKQAYDLALRQGRCADAASASTNLATNEANSGHLNAALKHLQQSLKLLEGDSNPDTDAITRLALIQVVDALGAEPAIALDACPHLFNRLVEHVGSNQWGAVQDAFHRLVDRHLQAHPELDAAHWKESTFPQLFREA